jgi:Rhomboid family
MYVVLCTCQQQAGVAGNLLSAVMSPNPALGASGAVFGIVSAYYVFLSRNDWLLGGAGEGMSSRLTQTLALNILLGALHSMIDNWGHLGSSSGSGGRMVIDRPIVRLPRSLESIPEKVSTQFRRISRRMQVERYKADRPTPPWQQQRQQPRPNRTGTPNRSIKPGKVD